MYSIHWVRYSIIEIFKVSCDFLNKFKMKSNLAILIILSLVGVFSLIVASGSTSTKRTYPMHLLLKKPIKNMDDGELWAAYKIDRFNIHNKELNEHQRKVIRENTKAEIGDKINKFTGNLFKGAFRLKQDSKPESRILS